MWTEQDIERVQIGISQLGWLVLKRFSAIYRPSEVLAAFSCLSKREFDTLRRLTFLNSDETARFLSTHTQEFLRVLPSTTQHMIEDRSGPPRGKIDWARTFVRRTQAGNDPTRFVTRAIDRTSDTASARLFYFMLSVIVENSEKLYQSAVPEIAKLRMAEQIESGRRYLALLKGRGVRPGGRITPREIAPLRKSRRPDILAAVQLYDLYVNVIELANEHLLRNLLQSKQHAPEDLDDLFEIWTLLTLVNLHLEQGWKLEEALLIGGDSSPKKPRFHLTKAGAVTEIFYQTVPKRMGDSSSYKAVFAEYDLDASMRRPDATIQVELPSGEVQRIIVEVKRTRDPRYILDSVYKTFGYLSDFKATVGPNSPMALLVVWDGVNRTTAAGAHPVVIMNASELAKYRLPY